MNPCWIQSADRDSTQPAKATKSLPASQPQWPPDKFTCLVHQPWVNRRSPIGPKQRDQWNPILLLGAVGINQNQLGNYQERWVAEAMTASPATGLVPTFAAVWFQSSRGSPHTLVGARLMAGQMPASAVIATVDPQKNVAFDHAAVGGLLGLGPIVIHDLGRSSATSWGEIMHDSVRLPRNQSDYPSAHFCTHDAQCPIKQALPNDANR